MIRSRSLFATLAVAASVMLVAEAADARMGGFRSSGSRGARTYTAPPVTRTAPKAVQPMQRSVTPGQPGAAQRTPQAAPTQAAAPGSFLSRPGLMGGLMGGLLGAGLFGLLAGNGLFGGLGGIASFLGLLLQLALIVIVARLALGWWRNRSAPAYAAAGTSPGGGGTARFDAPPRPGTGAPGMPGGLGGARPASSAEPSDEIGVTQEDLDTFEKLLAATQTAFGREDLATLRLHLTPEMVAYVNEDLAENASRGMVNRLSDIRLLQGDIAEAWREGGSDYATVAMRYSLIDVMEDRASGRTVEGDPDEPVEATELWTFRRARGGQWVVSAIQQT